MKTFLSDKRVRFILILGLFLAFGSIILAGIWYMTSPGGVSFFAPPAPTQEYSWSYVEIAKPIKMAAPIMPTAGTTINAAPSILIEDPATPVPLDTVIPLPTVTEAPSEMMMEILENTPAPVYAAPVQSEYAAGSPSYAGSKYILVDISEQHMYVYDGDTLLYSFVASTGINNATRVGSFAVQSKIPNAYGATWNIWMPNWLGIYWSGSLENGIHALPILSNGSILWEGFLGRPVSYGCVVLGTYESSLLYDWADVGTPVEIQW
jgi:lipoprotein-anchoring transpeptidase ErfK/SrfK